MKRILFIATLFISAFILSACEHLPYDGGFYGDEYSQHGDGYYGGGYGGENGHGHGSDEGGYGGDEHDD